MNSFNKNNPEDQKNGSSKSLNSSSQKMDGPKANAATPAGNKNTQAPSISVPKGGGALRGIGEKFSTNPVTGTSSVSIPLPVSPGRGASPADPDSGKEASPGFAPSLSLSYDSGAGNGIFGLGWNVGIPSITRKTDKGLPKYHDTIESDVFILSGAEDLVPLLEQDGDGWISAERTETIIIDGIGGCEYHVQPYRPRTDGLFARIERWTPVSAGYNFWKTISKENVTSVFVTPIQNWESPLRIFSWLLTYSYNDKGNVIFYQYDAFAAQYDLAHGKIEESHRTDRKSVV